SPAGGGQAGGAGLGSAGMGDAGMAGTTGAGGTSPVDAGMAGDAPIVDTTAPAVVSVTPTHGAAHLARDTPILGTLTEAMNQAAGEGAIVVSREVQGVTPAVVVWSYVWNTRGTAVTLTAPLAYATAEVIGGDGDAGTTPTAVQGLVARAFSVVVGVAAKDL